MSEWKRIDESNYEVSNCGQIRHRDSKNIRKLHAKNGYYLITLGKRTESVHRIVARHFLENTNNYRIVNHIDGNKLNNHVSNLEWTTQRQNVIHSVKNGLLKSFQRPVLQYDLDGTFIKEYASIKEAADIMKCSTRLIILVCDDRVYNKTAKGFVWKFKHPANICDITDAKPINGYNGRYLITPRGEVYSTFTQRKMKESINKNGYKWIQLSKNRDKKNFYIHCLVATYFLDEPEEHRNQVNHKDGNRSNNHVNNLEWVSQSENLLHSYKYLRRNQ